jgi:hypothetical protein
MARLIVNDGSATLGAALKQFQTKGLIHGALVRCLGGLWGYASNEPGVRHGATTTPKVKPHEAGFVVDSCEAALKLLLEVDRTMIGEDVEQAKDSHGSR